MSDGNSSKNNKIVTILNTFWKSIKKVCAAIRSFFHKLYLSALGGIKSAAAFLSGLFKRKKTEKITDETYEILETDNAQTKEFGAISGEDKAGARKIPFSLKKSKQKAAKQEKTRILPHISKEHLSGEGKEHINMFKPKQRNSSFVIGIALTSFKLLLIVIFMMGAAGIGTLVGVAKAYMETTPMLDTGKIEDQHESSYIYDGNDELITTYTGVENRDWATIEEIPERLQKAIIAIEDVRFEHHTGVDVKRLIGVVINKLVNSSSEGGSTITQQLIKNRLLTFEVTYKRKIQEAYLAMQLEQEYSKLQILEAYMNTIHLGGSNYGVKAAAMDYFGKDLDDLTLRESAMLAGITQYPYLYNPRRAYYDAEDPEPVNERTDEVLLKMYKAGFITKQEYEVALKDTVHIIEESKVLEMYDMPYFVEYAIHDVITHLLKQRNMQDTDQNRALLDKEIRTNGYHIYTTVDRDIQNKVQQSLEEWDKYPALEDEHNSVIRYESNNNVTEIIQPQAAAVIVEQSTGELKAVVGGRTTPEAKKTLNRAYQTTMPVGSSIKPIAVYAPAIDKGYSDGTIVPNLPVPIDGWDSERGYPLGGRSKYGPVSLRTALVNSLNSATAYTLLELVGLQDSKNYLLNMGVNPAHIQETGAGLALGTSGITPIEMAGAYATIANSGIYLEPLSFRYVEDKDGNVILSADDIREQRQVFKESTAWLVTDMLVEAVDEGTGDEAQIEGMTIGGKTGTNQDATGVFFAGISPYYTATVWIGHDKYKPLEEGVYASEYSAPLWQYFMSKVLEGMPDKPIIDADPEGLGLVKKRVCTVSGMLATSACNDDPGGYTPMNAWFLIGTEPTESCDVHQTHIICQQSGKIATQYCPDTDGNLLPQTLLFIDNDSVYWKLTEAQRAEYLPGMYHALQGYDVTDLIPSMPEYFDYYCDLHSEIWFTEQSAKLAAIEAANSQIAASKIVLADSTLTIPYADKQQLNAKISELETLIADELSTSGAIEQKTAELKSMTDTLVALYTPPAPTPTPTPPAPTPTPTPPVPTPTT